MLMQCVGVHLESRIWDYAHILSLQLDFSNTNTKTVENFGPELGLIYFNVSKHFSFNEYILAFITGSVKI